MLRRALPLAAVVAVALPATALATDRHVAKTGSDAGPNDCATQAAPCLTIQRAINASAPTGDVIHVGPGEFGESLSAASKNVTIRGAGSGPHTGTPNPSLHTIVKSPANFALRMFVGGAIEDIRIEGGTSGSAGPALIAAAIGAGDPLLYTADRVVLVGGAMGSVQPPAVRVDTGGTGRRVQLQVADSEVRVAGSTDPDPGGVLEVKETNAALFLTRTRVRGSSNADDTGVKAADGGLLSITDSTIGDDVSLAGGVRGDSTAGVVVNRSRVVATGAAVVMWAAAAADRQALLMIDSVIGPLPPVTGTPLALVAANGGVTTARVRQSTLVGSTSLGAVIALGQSGGKVDAILGNTIIENLSAGEPEINASASGGGDATVALGTSLYNAAESAGSAAVTTPGTGTNVTGDPRFLSLPTGNLRLQPGSPAVDRGDVSLLLPNEVDFDGEPRNVDGDGDCKAAPDMGALELQGQAKACPPAPGPPAAAQQNAPPPPPVAARPVLPLPRLLARISRLRVRTTRRAVRATFTLTQGAPVTFTLARERRCPKPRRGKRRKACKRWQTIATKRAAGRAGPNTISIARRLKKGRYRATLTATGGAAPAVTTLTAR